MQPKLFVSFPRIIQGGILAVVVAVVVALLIKEGSVNPLAGWTGILLSVYLIGWQVFQRTVTNSSGVSIVSGWVRRRSYRWASIESFELSTSHVVMHHSGGATRIVGLDDGAWFPGRYQKRMLSAAVSLNESLREYRITFNQQT
jgi:hypothetical protein